MARGRAVIEPVGQDRAGKGLGAAAGEKIVLVYRDCVPFLAEQMAEGIGPDDALEEWTQAASALLHILHAKRGNALLVEQSAFWEHTDVLNEELGLSGAESLAVLGIPAPGSEDGDGPYAVLQFLAEHHFRQAPLPRRLAAELEASTPLAMQLDRPQRTRTEDAFEALQGSGLVFGKNSPGTGQDELLLEKLQALEEELAASEARTDKLKEEINAALRQQIQLAEQLERRSAELHKKSREVERLERALADKGRQMGEQEQKLQQAQEEVSRLESVLRETRNELDETRKAARQDEQERIARLTWMRGELEHALAQGEARLQEVHALRNSTSWKITAPIRRIKRALTGRRHTGKSAQ